MNGVYNYNNINRGPVNLVTREKYDKVNDNGLDMELVSKGRLYESFEQRDMSYYGPSYTSNMQANGKIGIPVEGGHPGQYRLVDVDSDEGKARLSELSEERKAALAELAKYKSIKNGLKSASETVTETSDTEKSSVPKQQPETYKPNMDKIREMKNDLKNNIGAYKQMVFNQTKTQGQYAKTALQKMLDGVNGTTQEDAKNAIADDGYWGVEATANRILDFAKALSGGDPSKISELKNAVQKGFAAATKLWGGALPDICHQTLARVMQGFDEWEKTGNGAYSNQATANSAIIS